MSMEASEMTEKVFGSGSYEEALGIIGEYVNITSVDEPDEDIGMDMRWLSSISKIREEQNTSQNAKGKEN